MFKILANFTRKIARALFYVMADLYGLMFLGIRIVSNAGGVNPMSCAAAMTQAANKAGINLNIAVVTGDDLLFKVCFSIKLDW